MLEWFYIIFFCLSTGGGGIPEPSMTAAFGQ
jgi:hypothetical protein